MVGRTTYDFEGESALVTGSTSGIGQGIARSLAEADANVCVNSRTEAAVEETIAELDDLGAGDVEGVTADVSDPEAIERLVETAIESFQPVPNSVTMDSVALCDRRLSDAVLVADTG